MTVTRIAAEAATVAPSQIGKLHAVPTRYTDFSKESAKITIAFDMSIILIVGFVGAILRWERLTGFTLSVNQGLVVFFLPVIWFVSLAWENAWVFSWQTSPSELYGRVLQAGALTFGTTAAISFTLRAHYSRGYVFFSILIGTALLIFQRKFARARFLRRCAKQGIQRRYLALTCCESDPIVRQLQSDFPDVLCEGYRIEDLAGEWIADLRHYLLSRGIDVVILCDELANDSVRINQVAALLDQVDCTLYLPDALGQLALRRRHVVQSGITYSVLTEPHIQHSKAIFKRATDIAIATVALIILAPLMVIIAALIKLTSRGPVLFRQARVGINGDSFQFLKFRSMYQGSSVFQEAIWNEAKALGMSNNKMIDDPRVTRLGRFIRKTSLDELPQLVNVLNGSMSIVGPRPVQHTEFLSMDKHTQYRQIAKPGITGLWQVSGRSNTTWEERMDLDLDYIQNWSPFLDAVLILRTFRVLITGEGAY